MSDASAAAASAGLQPPSFVLTSATALAQDLLTTAATALAGYGVIQSSQTAQFVALGVSAVLWLLSYGWSRGEAYPLHLNASARVSAALQTPVPPSPSA